MVYVSLGLLAVSDPRDAAPFLNVSAHQAFHPSAPMGWIRFSSDVQE